MGNVSMIMDTYNPYLPRPQDLTWPQQPGPITPITPAKPGTVDVIDPAELRELIESFKAAVKAAEIFDRLTGQPDCVDPEKAKLEERVAELERRLDEMAAASA